MSVLHTAIAAGCINFLSFLCFAVTGFGEGILYQLGWYICALASAACSGSILEAVVHITVGGMIGFPLQIFLLWKHINWPLALELSLYVEIGLVAGTYVLVSYDSPWIVRSLGIFFFLVAIQKLGMEIPKDPEAAAPPAAEGRYVVDTREKRLSLIVIGLTSGVFGGLFATGGPPLMIFVAMTRIQKDEWRSTVAFCYLVENVARFIYLILIRNTINFETEYVIPIVLVVSAVLGLYLGNMVAEHVNQLLFRRLILGILGGGSLIMVAGGFEPWLMATLMAVGIFIYVGYGWALLIIQERHVRCRRANKAAKASVAANGDVEDTVEIELTADTPSNSNSGSSACDGEPRAVVPQPHEQEL